MVTQSDNDSLLFYDEGSRGPVFRAQGSMVSVITLFPLGYCFPFDTVLTVKFIQKLLTMLYFLTDWLSCSGAYV